jgi:hypothetical protein
MNMLFQWKKYLIPVLVSLLLLSGCSPKLPFVDKKWILTSYEQRGNKTIKETGIDYQLTFYDPFNIVKIEGGCRPGIFKYLTNNNRIRIYNPDAYSSFEHMDRCFAMIVRSTLESGMKYSLEGSTLTLTSYDGKHHKQLVFSETKNYQHLSFLKLLGLQILFMVLSNPYIVLAGIVALIVWVVRRKLKKNCTNKE